MPKCDQEITADGWFDLNSSALSNEYFTKANRFWLKQLKESKLNSDFIQKCKSDLDKERQKLDPFKIKHFEPIWNKPLESKKYFNELLDKERKDKMKRKREQLKADKNLNDLNVKMNKCLESKSSPNQSDKNSPPTAKKSNSKTKPARKRPAKPTKAQLRKSIQSPTDQNNQINLNTSPVPHIGSITIRKSIDTLSPIQSSSNQASPTNSKSFLISNNGKLFQIQQNIFVSPIDSGSNGRTKQSSSFKRNIDLNLDTKQDFECDCEQKPLSNCAVCQAFCHLSCLNSFNICDNCVKNNLK